MAAAARGDGDARVLRELSGWERMFTDTASSLGPIVTVARIEDVSEPGGAAGPPGTGCMELGRLRRAAAAVQRRYVHLRAAVRGTVADTPAGHPVSPVVVEMPPNDSPDVLRVLEWNTSDDIRAAAPRATADNNVDVDFSALAVDGKFQQPDVPVDASVALQPLWQRAARALTQWPFVEAEGYCFRVVLVHTGDDDHAPSGSDDEPSEQYRASYLLVCTSHTLTDGISGHHIVSELLRAYCDSNVNKWLPLQAPDDAMASTNRRLCPLLPPLARILAPVALRGNIGSGAGGSFRMKPARACSIDDVSVATAWARGSVAGLERLRRKCKEEGVTVGAALHAAVALCQLRRIGDVTGTLRLDATGTCYSTFIDVAVDTRRDRGGIFMCGRRGASHASQSNAIAEWFSQVPGDLSVRRDATFWDVARSSKRIVDRFIWLRVPELLTTLVHWIATPDYRGKLTRAGWKEHGYGGAHRPMLLSNIGRWQANGGVDRYGNLQVTGVWTTLGQSFTGTTGIVWAQSVGERLCYSARVVVPVLMAQHAAAYLSNVASFLEPEGDAPAVWSTSFRVGDWLAATGAREVRDRRNVAMVALVVAIVAVIATLFLNTLSN